MLLLSSLSLLELLPLLLDDDEGDEWRRLLFLCDDLLALCSALSAAVSMVATDSGICSRLVAGLGTGFSFCGLLLLRLPGGGTTAVATTCCTKLCDCCLPSLLSLKRVVRSLRLSLLPFDC